MTKKIFLSYSLSDKELVETFKHQLLENKNQYELVEHSTIENTEEKWKNSVQKKIKEAEIIFCLFGFSTWESEAVKWEVTTALENKKQILVIKLKPAVFMFPNYLGTNNIKVIENDIELIENEIN